MQLSTRLKTLLLAFSIVVFAIPVGVSAQGAYFGRNKVQYQRFDFQVLKTEHFDIYYYPEAADAARMTSRMAERWYERFAVLFDHQLRGRQPIILYASGPHFRQTNVIEGELGEGTGGVTEAGKRRIVLPLAGPIESTDHVLGHELVHAFQYDITNTTGNSGPNSALSLPLWFIEGMAEYLSIGPVDPHTAMWMRDSTRREKLPDIDHLDDPKYFPYRYGLAFWAFVGGKYGDRTIGNLLRFANGRDGYDAAFKKVLGVDSKQLSKEWHDAQAAAYQPVAEVTKMPASFARPLITKQHSGGQMNVSPQISPDGSRLMFFSERDLFSIDLYLADARTGKILRKITNTATNPHFESLQFLTSTGAWDSASKRFAFPGISAGRPILAIIDADSGRKLDEITLNDVDEVFNPAWSPDGNQVAFSGLVGGYNDLFVYDLSTKAVRRLTNDPYAELDPAWSPDGRQLAFSTDRFTTKLPQLAAGHMKLAIMDVASGQVRDAGGFDGAKNIDPQWSQDGRSLFFLSDRQGITNVYRLSIDGGEPMQLTNILTGVSGITSLSPALSAGNGRMVFSAYEDDGYNIYALDGEKVMAETEPIQLPIDAGVLPPRRTGEGPVFAAIRDVSTGLPPSAPAESQPYKPKFSLLYAGQPMIGVGTDPFGTYATGGVSFLFSDTLGNNILATSAQVTNRLDEFGGSVFYLNRTHRWNWGIGIDQTPYIASAFTTGVDFSGNQPVLVESEFRIKQIDRGVSGVASYPFSAARRVEFSGGVRQLTLSEDVTDRIFDQFGNQIGQDRSTLASFPTLNLGQAAAALVYDTAISGVTSPIKGTRYRLELSQNAGSLTYTGALLDYRTYLMPVRPYTFALRGLYFGRFGADAEDQRLPTLFLGYPGLVRGYDSGSFQGGECGAQINGSCPVFDRLIGSRIGVANAEFRFPLWGAFRRDSFYGPLPIEVGVFGDAGVAWSRTNSVSFAGDQKPVSSAGFVARVNLLGFAIAEFDYVHPFNRPGRGWVWQFNLSPGF